ncbi:hypothetical protein F2P81_005654 [Scophthalmus maximus]|uniref:Uncharacterized protein n=1 Tax=Scophthalmus maximus TaxID=52904 RepID=A0A6A4TJ80_SCOMX|nr:hypothetical protein F2P81_005654 [Scophthalmus maximus]
MASRLEINFIRLLSRCESIASEKRGEAEWRLEKVRRREVGGKCPPLGAALLRPSAPRRRRICRAQLLASHVATEHRETRTRLVCDSDDSDEIASKSELCRQRRPRPPPRCVVSSCDLTDLNIDATAP